MSEPRYGIGDLPAAGAVADTDSSAICQNPNGCSADDPTVTMLRVTQYQLSSYYRTRFAGTPPLTYSAASGTFGLAIDETLRVSGGQLGVTPGQQITVPVSPLLSGNGSVMGIVAVGQGLQMQGVFPNQTLFAETSGEFLPLSGGVLTGPVQTIYGGGVGANAGMGIALGDPATGFNRSGGTTPTASIYLWLNGTPIQTWDTGAGLSQLGLALNMTSHQINFLAAPSVATDALNLGFADGRYLALGGGSMNGPLIAATGSGLTNVGLGIGDNTTGFYRVGSTVALALGGTLNVQFMTTGMFMGVPLNMATQRITNVGNPTAAGDALSQGFADGRYLQLATGGTLSGELQMFATGGTAVPQPGITFSTRFARIYWDDVTVPTGLIIRRGTANEGVYIENNDASARSLILTQTLGDARYAPLGSGGGITGITAGPGITVTPDPVSPTVAVVATGLPITLGGTGATTAGAARTNLGLTAIATQPAPLGSLYGGTQIQPSSAQTFNSLIATPTSVGGPYQYIPSGPASTIPVTAGSILQANASGPPSFVLPITVASGGTGATTFTAGNLIGMGGGGVFLGVPTPLAVNLGGTGLGAGTSGGIPYFSAAATMASSAALTANFHMVGGGAGAAPRSSTLLSELTTPSNTLLFNTNASTPTPTANGTNFTIQGSDTVAGNTRINMSSNSGLAGNIINANSYRGTLAARTPTQVNDLLFEIGAYGFPNNGGYATIDVYASETWSATAGGTRITFTTTTPGTVSPSERMRIGQGVMIGTTTEPGAGNLILSGSLTVTGNPNPTLSVASGGAYTALFAPDGSGASGCLYLGITGDPFLYRNTSHVFQDRPGATSFAQIDRTLAVSVPTVGSNGGQFRMTNNAGYGSMWQNDGTNTYLLLTNTGDWNGPFNALRPLTIESATGNCVFGNSIEVGAPTGGQKGNGTINAVQVWANGVQLTSDARIKRDIEALPDDCLALVTAIAPKTFRRIPPEPLRTPIDRDDEVPREPGPPGFFDRRNWGFIAQEVAEVMTRAGHEFGGHIDEGEVQSLSYNDLIAVLWKGTQELAARVATLEATANPL